MAEMGGNWPATWGEEREREREANSKFESAPICGRSAWAEWRWAVVAGDAVEWSVVGAEEAAT